MKMTFSYFPGMFETSWKLNIISKNKIKTFYEKSTIYKCGERYLNIIKLYELFIIKILELFIFNHLKLLIFKS